MAKPILAVLASLTALGGAVFAIDARYVHAEDFKKQIFVVKDSIADLHRARVEDEIFKLELIPPSKRTQADKALLDRYKTQLREIDSKRERDR